MPKTNAARTAKGRQARKGRMRTSQQRVVAQRTRRGRWLWPGWGIGKSR